MGVRWGYVLACSMTIGVIITLIQGYAISTYSIAMATGAALGLVVVPTLLLALPAGAYWAVKRQTLPNVGKIFWAIWALIAFMGVYGTYLMELDKVSGA